MTMTTELPLAYAKLGDGTRCLIELGDGTIHEAIV